MNLDDVTDRSVAIIQAAGRECLHCGGPIDIFRGSWWDLIRQPGGAAAGQFYTLCSNTCLALFIQGGEA